MTDGDPIKRGRGRPRKHPIKTPDEKQPRGRPRKDAWVVRAVDLLFELKDFKSLQAALASLVSEYPGMERAKTMKYQVLRKEPTFEKLIDKARHEIKSRLDRKAPEQSIHFPMHVFRLLALISKRRLSQKGPKIEEAKRSRRELREIVNWLDDRLAQRQKQEKPEQ